VEDHASLQKALDVALPDDNLWIVNVKINPTASRKAQQFNWLTRDDNVKEKPKL